MTFYYYYYYHYYYYADDLVLLTTSELHLESALEILVTIATKWGMKLNYGKTKLNNNNNRRLVTLAEHTSDHGRQTNKSKSPLMDY